MWEKSHLFLTQALQHLGALIDTRNYQVCHRRGKDFAVHRCGSGNMQVKCPDHHSSTGQVYILPGHYYIGQILGKISIVTQRQAHILVDSETLLDTQWWCPLQLLFPQIGDSHFHGKAPDNPQMLAFLVGVPTWTEK